MNRNQHYYRPTILRIAAFAISMAVAGPAQLKSAQTDPPTGEVPEGALTLDAAMKFALENNATVIQTFNRLEGSRSSSKAAFGNFLPSFDLGAGFNRQQYWQNNPGGVTIINGVPVALPPSSFSAGNNYSVGISGDIVFFNGLGNINNLEAANASEAAAGFNLERVKQATLFQTYQLFLDVGRTAKLMEVAGDNLKRSQRQLERIEESNRVGAVALADVYRQQVTVGNDELAMIQAQSNFEKAESDLFSFIGLEYYKGTHTVDVSSIPIAIDTTEFAANNRMYTDYSALVDSALNRRPDYRAISENLNAADASVSVASAGHWPVVRGSGSYRWDNENLSDIKDNRTLNLGVNISLPIFQGFSIDNQVELAKVSKLNAEEDVYQARRQIAVDVRKALLDLEASQKQLLVTTKSVQSAEMDRKIEEEKYNLGAGTLLDLLVANAGYTNALSNRVNAVAGYLISKKGVDFALGTIVP